MGVLVEKLQLNFNGFLAKNACEWQNLEKRKGLLVLKLW